MHKQDMHSGDLTNLSWEQLKNKLDLLREKRKQNIVIQVLSKLLSDEDNPYCEEENRIRMAMFQSHVATENNENNKKDNNEKS